MRNRPDPEWCTARIADYWSIYVNIHSGEAAYTIGTPDTLVHIAKTWVASGMHNLMSLKEYISSVLGDSDIESI